MIGLILDLKLTLLVGCEEYHKLSSSGFDLFGTQKPFRDPLGPALFQWHNQSCSSVQDYQDDSLDNCWLVTPYLPLHWTPVSH